MNDKFKDEVKDLLRGYMNPEEENIIDYVALKIARIHEECMKEHLEESGEVSNV